MPYGDSEPHRWRIEGDALYHIHSTGSRHLVTGVAIIANADRKLVLYRMLNPKKPEGFDVSICERENVPKDAKDVVPLKNDGIWFKVEPSIDGVGISLITEMNDMMVEILKECKRRGIYQPEGNKRGADFDRFASEETKRSLGL